MPFAEIGLIVTKVGSMVGILIIIFGAFLYLIENKNRGVMFATAARALGVGSLIVMVSIPFSIPNLLLSASSIQEISMLSIIIISVFLGSPLIFMGLASFISLHAKAHVILRTIVAQGELETLSPIQKK